MNVLQKDNYLLIPTPVTGASQRQHSALPSPCSPSSASPCCATGEGPSTPQPSELASDAVSSLLPRDRSCLPQRRNLPAACSGFYQAKGKEGCWLESPAHRRAPHTRHARGLYKNREESLFAHPWDNSDMNTEPDVKLYKHLVFNVTFACWAPTWNGCTHHKG